MKPKFYAIYESSSTTSDILLRMFLHLPFLSIRKSLERTKKKKKKTIANMETLD